MSVVHSLHFNIFDHFGILRFEHNAALFTIFVVLTGGCYPALDVISSNAFGNDLFSAGLTAYEMKQMMKIKIINSVMLENVKYFLIENLEFFL